MTSFEQLLILWLWVVQVKLRINIHIFLFFWENSPPKKHYIKQTSHFESFTQIFFPLLASKSCNIQRNSHSIAMQTRTPKTLTFKMEQEEYPENIYNKLPPNLLVSRRGVCECSNFQLRRKDGIEFITDVPFCLWQIDWSRQDRWSRRMSLWNVGQALDGVSAKHRAIYSVALYYSAAQSTSSNSNDNNC